MWQVFQILFFFWGGVDCSPAHLSSQNVTYTHQMLCCRITTINFYAFNNF